MKRGELIILWIGGLLSVAILLLKRPPAAGRLAEVYGDPTAAGYAVELIAWVVAVWIVCGLVWATIYRRKH